MTAARSHIVDLSVTSWYHVISKTVRGARLLCEGNLDRKQWIEDRLELLAEVFAVEIGGFAILDNHLHLLVNLLPDQISSCSDEEVLARWYRIHPPRLNRKPLEITRELLALKATDQQHVTEVRKRLANLGWFMKSLKEPIARLANQQDSTEGSFWQGRYKSIAILDTEALLAVSAYIDLNVFAAGMAKLPEESPYTSIRRRVAHCAQQGRLTDLQAAKHSSVHGVRVLQDLESNGLWLCPIEDRRHLDATARHGLLDGFSLGSYLQLIDWTSRIARKGKAHIANEVTSLLDRLDTSADNWTATMKKLFNTSRHRGVAFAFSRRRLREAAAHYGRQRLANLNGCCA